MLSTLVRVVALVALSVVAQARGSVQLQLAGEVSNETGSSVDLEVSARGDGPEPKLAALHLFVLPHTSAADIAALFARRLEALHIAHVLTSGPESRERASLFIEGISRIEVRVSDGLSATLGLPEDAPAAVQVLPPLARRGKGSVRFHGATWDARMRQRGAIDFRVELAEDTSPTGAAEAFVTACSQAHWLSEKPSHESWRPSDSLEGVGLAGTSLAVDSRAADWGLELRLPERPQ